MSASIVFTQPVQGCAVVVLTVLVKCGEVQGHSPCSTLNLREEEPRALDAMKRANITLYTKEFPIIPTERLFPQLSSHRHALPPGRGTYHSAPVPSAHGRIANSDLCIRCGKHDDSNPRYRHLNSGWKIHDTHTCPPTHDPQLPGIHVYMARRPPTNKSPGRGTQASC